MQTSVIRHRVADFLKSFPPFDSFSETDLLQLAGSGRVKFHQSDEYVFRQGDAKGQFVWIIQQGRVELREADTSGEQLRDVLGEGDLLGMERLVGDGRCQFSARTASDVILYGVDAALFESLIPRYPFAKQFLAAHFSIAGNLGFGRTSWLDAEPPPLEFLRFRLAQLPRFVPAIKTSSLTTRTAIREMLRAGSEELAITEDGTLETRVEAGLLADELGLFCGRNPALLVKLIRHASSSQEIQPLLRCGHTLILDGLARPDDVADCRGIAEAISAASVEACIRLAQQCAETSAPLASFCWFTFGEPARADLLQPALPRLAAIYDDSAADSKPEYAAHLAKLTDEIDARFKECGSASYHWPKGCKPCMSLSEWKQIYSDTIGNPFSGDLYVRSEFFDTRVLFGDGSVLQKLREHIQQQLGIHEMTIPLLANDTLANLPPLTFFRGLVLGLDGLQRDSFDIGTVALNPIASAARVFAIAQGRLAVAGTLERLTAAEVDFPDDSQILRDAAAAFRIALYYQVVAGNRIEPAKLGKFDQRLLKTAFSSIQRLLEFTYSRFVPSV